jgi:hypothetical protein
MHTIKCTAVGCTVCCGVPCFVVLLAVGAGNVEGGLDFANMLKPALARSQLQVIGATTLDEYRQHIESDPALTRRFQVGKGRALCCVLCYCCSLTAGGLPACCLQQWPKVVACLAGLSAPVLQAVG